MKRFADNMLKCINKKSIYFVLIILLCNLVLGDSIVISLEYSESNAEFTLDNSYLTDTTLRKEPRKFEHYFVVYSVENQILDQGYVAVPGFKFTHSSEDDSYMEDIKTVTVISDYFPTIKELVIFDKNDESKLTIDLLKYNKCNLNNVCDEKENKVLCPEDCHDSLKDGLCQNIEDGVCDNDPDCQNEDPDCIIKQNKVEEAGFVDNIEESVDKESITVDEPKNFPIRTFFLMFVIVFVSLILYFINNKRKNVSS